ncbi:MAG: response regulator [Calditrichaeota bacterium]|nr:response regulator [Calditrichota bacterium]
MKKILVIDDEEMILDMLKQILEREGYEVLTASDGTEGMDAFQHRQIDLVITDIFMPRKEGISVVYDLREKYPETKIVAISGGGRLDSKDYLRYAEKLGADQTLAKPFSRSEILKVVEALVGKG